MPPFFLPDGQVTVRPTEIDEILDNPGMGFADFHFGIGSPLPFSQYPRSTVAYVRWSWADLEPAEEQYDFGRIDSVIEQAKAMGETLAFRIMTQTGMPQWLLDKGVPSVKAGGGMFPDYNNPSFSITTRGSSGPSAGGSWLIRRRSRRHRLGGLLGRVEHRLLPGGGSGLQELLPDRGQPDRHHRLVPQTLSQDSLVMLVGGQLKYAVSRGAGWRGDCFGDYGMFGPGWNHMVDVYEPAAQDPVIGNAWKTGAGPVRGLRRDAGLVRPRLRHRPDPPEGTGVAHVGPQRRIARRCQPRGDHAWTSS